MGGAVGGGFTDAPMGTVAGEGERFGNVTPYAEFNVYCDPESARSLLDNSTLASKTTLITLDLTHRFLATQKVQNAMLHGYESTADGSEPSLARKLFVEILTFFAKTYADVFSITAGPPLHDVLAVAATFAPMLFDDNGGERYEVDVVTEGAHGASPSVLTPQSQCGRTNVTPVLPNELGVRIPRGVDADKVWRYIDRCLSLVETAEG